MAERLGHEQFSTNAGDVTFPSQIAPVEAAANEAASAVNKNTGKEVQEFGRFGGRDLGQGFLFLQRVPGVTEQIVYIGDRDLLHSGALHWSRALVSVSTRSGDSKYSFRRGLISLSMISAYQELSGFSVSAGQ